MQKPKRLYYGDTVALVNPAGMPPERFRRYIPLMEEYLKTEGFQTKMYLAPDGVDNKSLAETFMKAWLDDQVQALFPICGSDRIYDVIRYLDKDAIRSRSIIFCGSSLLSALSIWISQQAEVCTFFGPHIPFIHAKSPQRENEFTIQSFWDMCMWKMGRTKRIANVHERHHFFRVQPEAETVIISNIYHKTELIQDQRRRDVSFLSSYSGEISGNIACVTLGTLLEMTRRDLLLPLGGHILFTETMECKLESVFQALNEVVRHPSLDGIHGIFITALTERTDRAVPIFEELRDKLRLSSLCSDISQDLGIPVWYGFPMGHCAYKITLPQAIRCSVSLTTGSVSLAERPFL